MAIEPEAVAAVEEVAWRSGYIAPASNAAARLARETHAIRPRRFAAVLLGRYA